MRTNCIFGHRDCLRVVLLQQLRIQLDAGEHRLDPTKARHSGAGEYQ